MYYIFGGSVLTSELEPPTQPTNNRYSSYARTHHLNYHHISLVPLLAPPDCCGPFQEDETNDLLVYVYVYVYAVLRLLLQSQSYRE